ncbi:MAG: methylenetetrahydrofolate reductase [Gammaproteobacteria bacterium]|nr:methylenetetrahydrofolate reductase [Gammaproteobacteria bacterium]
MANCTLEITPGGAKKIENFRDLLRDGTTVYVTFLPGSDFNDTVATVKRLFAEGMKPIPHIAARSTPSAAFLEENLRMLRDECNIDHVLLIGGGVDNPVGEFDSSIQVLRTGLFQKYGIKHIGVAGHPEGSPDIPPADVTTAMLQKNEFAKETGIDMYIATQFCFEAEPIIEWDKTIRGQGNKLPVHIGIPGLATIKTLLGHAKACGIGPSMRVITRQAANIAKLMTTREPDKLVRDLAVHKAANADCGIKQCHLYPLGGLRKSAAWLYAVQDGEFELNDEGGFKVLREIS